MKKHYLPFDDQGRLAWLTTFNSKISTYVMLFGMTSAEITAIEALRDNISFQRCP